MYIPCALHCVVVMLRNAGTPPQLQEFEDKEKLSEKCPSFELVLNFVKNEALSVEIVHSILQRRSRLASTVAQACTFASEYLRSMEGSIFEVCVREERRG